MRFNVLVLGFLGCAQGFGAAEYFIAANGNDAWTGKLAAPNSGRTDGPFASLAKAQEAVRSLIKTNPSGPIAVEVRGGTYYLPLSPTSPGILRFSAEDSGTSAMPITWSNYQAETPIVSGGAAIGKGGLGLTWKHVSGSLWQVQLPANTKAFEY